jgi:hypothetical protein
MCAERLFIIGGGPIGKHIIYHSIDPTLFLTEILSQCAVDGKKVSHLAGRLSTWTMKIPRCTPQTCHVRGMHTDATVSGKHRSLLQRRYLTLCNTQQVTWRTLGGGSGGDGRITPRMYRPTRTDGRRRRGAGYSGERCSPQVQ